MKQFTLHLQTIAQNIALDHCWFGEVWFPVDKSEWGVDYAQAQDNIVDPGDLDLNLVKTNSNCAFPDHKCETQHMPYWTVELLMFFYLVACYQEEHAPSNSV